jgi:uncharacterized membrane protein
MADQMPADLQPPPPEAATYPVSSGERTTVLVHYYRAEMDRMTSWRDRIDRTSNWAITVVAAMLSLSLSTPQSHHGMLLFAMLLVSLLLLVEARRYRFFDVYRNRVRRMERYYFAHVLDPLADPDPEWAQSIAADLRTPAFLISLQAAVSRRLRRNYIWIYLILLLAWVVKIGTRQLQAGGAPLYRIVDDAALGPLDGRVVLVAVAAGYLWLAWYALQPRHRAGELVHGDVHV